MNSSYYRFSLEVQSVQSQVYLPVSMFDTARSLYMNFTDGGKPYSIAPGCMAKLTITRPSGSKIHEFCAIKNGTTVIYSFSQNKRTAAEEGIHECEVTLYGSNGAQITSPRFTMIVSERVVNDDSGITEEHIGIIDDIVRAELERKEAEEGRYLAELGRVEAEQDRAEGEENRSLAEQGRVEAERSRADAFVKVEIDTAEAIGKIIAEQEGIIALQERLIADTATADELAEVIALQEQYIGGVT